MPSIVSFPNFLCLLLTGVWVVHMVTRIPIEGSFPDVSDDLEVIYCKLPQSRKAEDSIKCSSAQKLFSLLRNGCSLENRLLLNLGSNSNETEIEVEEEPQVVTVEVAEEAEVEVKEAMEELPEEEMKSSLVDSFVISLLVCSAIASLLEWHRERSRKEEKTGREGPATTGGGEGASDRRISLVDLTVNRHIRRDSQQAEALRQNSAQGSRPPLLRRSSFPAQVPEVRIRHAPQRQQSIPASTRRMSIDLEDDGSPDRRRVKDTLSILQSDLRATRPEQPLQALLLQVLTLFELN